MHSINRKETVGFKIHEMTRIPSETEIGNSGKNFWSSFIHDALSQCSTLIHYVKGKRHSYVSRANKKSSSMVRERKKEKYKIITRYDLLHAKDH